MTCSMRSCKFYTVLIEDDDDNNGCPWCLLADTALPDDCFAPFDCIVPDRDERAERVEEIQQDLERLPDAPPLNDGLLTGLVGFEAIAKEEE